MSTVVGVDFAQNGQSLSLIILSLANSPKLTKC